MTPTKVKTKLTDAQETLLITLYAKAIESQQPNPIFNDDKARSILDQIDYDFARLNVLRKTSITLCIRARILDDIARAFLRQHPEAVILRIGCGLDSRVYRVPHDQAEWYDLDFPSVIDLRRLFYDVTVHNHMIASSVTDLAWTDAVQTNGRPVLVIAEGLLMYLSEAEVKALIAKLREKFSRCQLAADVFSTMTVKRVKAHPSLSKTTAVIQWGIDDAREIETWGDGIRLLDEQYFMDAPEVDKLNVGYRMAFKLAGMFSAAKKAQRIIHLGL